MKFKKIISKVRANKLFWKEISKNTEALNFFSKNSFALSKVKNDTIFGILEFFKVGIIDNSLNLYADIDEIKSKIEATYNTELAQILSSSEFDLGNYFKINVNIDKYKLIKFNPQIAQLKNSKTLDRDLIIESVKTNAINDPEVKNVIDENLVYVYVIEFYYKDLEYLLNLNNKFKNFLVVFTSIIIIIMLMMLLFFR